MLRIMNKYSNSISKLINLKNSQILISRQFCKLNRPDDKQNFKEEPKDPISPLAIFVFSTLLGLSIQLLDYTKKKKSQVSKEVVVESYGKPAFGGDFELVDKNGQTVTLNSQTGFILMMYFGFLHCPDICPEEVDKLAKAKFILDRENVPSKLLFVSLDPARDTPELMKEQVAKFESKHKVEIDALTGNEEQVEFVKRQYRLYSSASEKDEDGNQNVDHTVATQVVDPSGLFVNVMPQIQEAEKCAKVVNQYYKEWKLKQLKL